VDHVATLLALRSLLFPRSGWLRRMDHLFHGARLRGFADKFQVTSSSCATFLTSFSSRSRRSPRNPEYLEQFSVSAFTPTLLNVASSSSRLGSPRTSIRR